MQMQMFETEKDIPNQMFTAKKKAIHNEQP
jgi:hypothetical protein